MNSQPNTKVFRRSKHRRLLEQAQLVQTVQELAAEVATLRSRLAQIERSHPEPVYHVPQSLAALGPRRQPPPGQTAMQAIQGQWPGEETTEELLAMLKALD